MNEERTPRIAAINRKRRAIARAHAIGWLLLALSTFAVSACAYVRAELFDAPSSLWRKYAGIGLIVVAIGVLETLTIGALLWQRRRRKIAEDAAAMQAGELARASRFALAGELSASIAHEVAQPLGAILSNADAAGIVLKDEPEVNELHSILADIRRDALRANQVVQRLRALLEKHTPGFAPLELNSTFDEALSLFALEARRRQIVIESHQTVEDARVLGDRIQLQQVVLNLAINAMDAMECTPTANRVLSVSMRRVGRGYELAVADRGHGIPAAARERLFDSLYTTKPHGMGLGLSIVRSIVVAHGGHVSSEPREGGGSRFTMWIPSIPEQPGAKPRPEVGYTNPQATFEARPTTQGLLTHRFDAVT